MGGGLCSYFVGAESIGVDGSIFRFSPQGKSLRYSNLLLVVIGAVSSVDICWLFFSFCDVLFAIRVSVKFLPYHSSRNHLLWSMRSPCCVGSAWVVLVIGFVLWVGRSCK